MPEAPKPKIKHEVHVHHFHVHENGDVRSEYQKLVIAGRNPEDDALEEEGKKMESLDLPPCNLNEPNSIDCDMSSALALESKKRGMSTSDINAAKDPSADNINAMLNDNPPDDVALASLEKNLHKESNAENKHLKELEQSEAQLDLTATKGRFEEAGLALEKREVKREIAESQQRLAQSHATEAQLAEKKQEAETQLALDNQQAQSAIQEAVAKAAQETMLEEQRRQEVLQNQRIQSQSPEAAVNENYDTRVSSTVNRPERITYLYLAGGFLLSTIALYCYKRSHPHAGYLLLDGNLEEV